MERIITIIAILGLVLVVACNQIDNSAVEEPAVQEVIEPAVEEIPDVEIPEIKEDNNNE